MWNDIFSGGNSHPSRSGEDESSEHLEADMAVVVPSLDDIGMGDLMDEEEGVYASSQVSNDPRPSPKPLPVLKLGVVEDEIREEIENLEEQ
jgi:hypothetical protein